ncbi:MAG: PD-(D/E)XK nuclease domain-containing protein, partial [Victivallales bacterium]|nr:PD-(D/E)XK nuclease domain-containing protein [Victivallales bacterium]
MKLSYADYRAELKRWFNGYRFGLLNAETVYNPVSIGVNLAMPRIIFRASWADTGKASMLMNFLKRGEYLSVNMEQVVGVDAQTFDVFNLHDLKTIPMLYQTGYLTIDRYHPELQTFDLRVPDEEVRRDLLLLTTSVIAGEDVGWAANLGKKLLLARWPEFFVGLKALYAGMPYGPSEASVQEYSFERVLLTLLRSQGIQCAAEDRQANGQADVVAVHPCGVYIFELKVDESAEAALEQVRAKGYDAPYRGQGRPVWLVGLSFDRRTRQLIESKAEQRLFDSASSL